MALEGSVKDFGLADIFQLIYFHKKTGILVLTRQSERVRLMFHEGNVVSAESRDRSEEQRVGRILLKEGLIKEEDLRTALEEQKRTGGRIAGIFYQRGLIGTKDIKKTLSTQITDTVTRLFSWNEGTYEFEPLPVPLDKDMPVSLDTQHLLMECLRVIDEWSLVEGKIRLEMVLVKSEDRGHVLTPEEETVLRFVDGENDVGIIIELSGLEDFEVLRTLVSLMDRGVIKPAEAAPAEAKVAKPRVKEIPASFMMRLSTAILIAALGISMLMAVLQKKSPMSLAVFWDAGLYHRLKTVKEIDKLRFMADAYRYEHGSYPADPGEVGRIKDMWGTPYVYMFKDNSLLIRSAGPDGKVGTGDDIY